MMILCQTPLQSHLCCLYSHGQLPLPCPCWSGAGKCIRDKFSQPPRSSDWRFEHRLATSITLASVMLVQPKRSSVWRFEHPLATSDTAASVMFLGSLSVWRFEHPLATSDTAASVMLLGSLSVWSFKHPLATSTKLASVMLVQQ